MEIFRPYGFDKTLFFSILILMALGLIMVYSSSAILASEQHQNSFHFFINQGIVAGIGLVLIFLMLPIKKPFYNNAYFVYGLLLLSLILLVLCLLMPALAKTNRWVQFFGLRFQPSELAKLSLILFFAHYFDRKREKMNDFQTLLFPLIILILFILLIIKEPDYGTALLIFLICLIMLFIGGLSLKYFLFLGIPTLGLFAFYLFQASYRMNRILAFLSPTKDPQGTGFQIIQSKLAIGAGGLFGVSFGGSTQKLFFLPCSHTDYIYAIVGEELGLIGTVAILFLFLVILWRGLVISKNAPNFFSQILAAGITLALFAQALLNISIVLGLGPPTGIPLPLISYGRSSLLCTLFGIGILLNISQRKENLPKKK
ncbi:MAG: putative lipid II flippase FtsW [Candidatus Aminicenantes bacterium]|nr:MAG: putative lipid II flippase FtsW [Candidatus Aminicenantes bacterium]